ncbi:hypothetical protein ES703_14097 [subsurface metagenome]|nr:hypothetical protein [bacterium]
MSRKSSSREGKYRLIIPGKEDFLNNLQRELDPMYKVAKRLLDNSWGSPPEMVEGVGVLLLTWNQPFYGRFGWFKFEELEKCLANNLKAIKGFKEREIFSFSSADEDVTKALFDEFLEALKGVREAKAIRTPVGVTKALHLLAPKFFPMWDDQIAKDYRCYWYSSEGAAEKYICFCEWIKEVAEEVRDYPSLPSDRTLVKLIDEYNHKTRSTKEEKHYKVLRKAS